MRTLSSFSGKTKNEGREQGYTWAISKTIQYFVFPHPLAPMGSLC